MRESSPPPLFENLSVAKQGRPSFQNPRFANACKSLAMAELEQRELCGDFALGTLRLLVNSPSNKARADLTVSGISAFKVRFLLGHGQI